MRKYLNPCSVQELRLFVSLSDGGELRWLRRSYQMFAGTGSEQRRISQTWNSRFAGKRAGSSASGQARKYRTVSIYGVPLKVHRVVFALHHGRWPEGDVDHIDGNIYNNDPSNLREVNHATNCRNQKLRSTNTSGCMGVHFDKRRGVYAVSISADGSKIHIGSYPSVEHAEIARRAAAKALGYHKNHGRKSK
jgi:hypothetical protein